jgi:hypothetical protein
MNTETSLDTITATATTDLAKQLTSDALVTWSDERRQAFVETFNDRTLAARYILLQTAFYVREVASKRHYLSSKHTDHAQHDLYDLVNRCKTGRNWELVGGRSTSDLNKIAQERADEIIKQLPSMASAVRILNPEAAGWIERRDKLVAKGTEILEASKEVAGPLDLADFPGTTTLTEIRKLGEDREAKRIEYQKKLDKLGKEGLELEQKIDRFLYDGLPGLSDAVTTLISNYIDKSIAFETMQRRVAEQVKFGDSAAAVELLRGFENDERKVSSDVKSQFNEALEKLKLIAAKGRKAKQAPLLKGGHEK